MNKRTLKSYLKKSRRAYLEQNCFKYDNGYLISDSYSIIKLNDANELKEEKDILGVCGLYQSFIDNYKFFSEYIPLWATEESIDRDYSINMTLFKKINTIIKGNEYAIMKSKNSCSGAKYIIKLENTKTKEIAFLLPMRKF